jgi:hypothetical protein
MKILFLMVFLLSSASAVELEIRRAYPERTPESQSEAITIDGNTVYPSTTSLVSAPELKSWSVRPHPKEVTKVTITVGGVEQVPGKPHDVLLLYLADSAQEKIREIEKIEQTWTFILYSDGKPIHVGTLISLPRAGVYGRHLNDGVFWIGVPSELGIQSKTTEPNQSLQTMTTAVTCRAAHAPRQLRSCLI